MNSYSNSKEDILDAALIYANELLNERIPDKYLRRRLRKVIEYKLKQLINEMNEDNYREIVEKLVDSLLSNSDLGIIVVSKNNGTSIGKGISIPTINDYDRKISELKNLINNINSIVNELKKYEKDVNVVERVSELKKSIDEITIQINRLRNYLSSEIKRLDKRINNIVNEVRTLLNRELLTLRSSFEELKIDYEIIKKLMLANYEISKNLIVVGRKKSKFLRSRKFIKCLLCSCFVVIILLMYVFVQYSFAAIIMGAIVLIILRWLFKRF